MGQNREKTWNIRLIFETSVSETRNGNLYICKISFNTAINVCFFIFCRCSPLINVCHTMCVLICNSLICARQYILCEIQFVFLTV